MRTSDHDVYASTVGGVKVAEPGADLGVALAVVSAMLDVPLPRDLVAVGEVGLAGEVRQVPQTARRLAEAARLGYRRAIVPKAAPEVDGIRSIVADTVADVVVRVLSAASGRRDQTPGTAP
jgi:DNA repair protein RadA/Sms